MPHVGFPEVVVLLVIALVIFGPRRLPELGRSLGEGIRSFRDSVQGASAPAKSSVPAATLEEQPREQS